VRTHVGAGLAAHELAGDRTLEDVLEERRERVVHVEEVRHVDDVVDDLAAVGVDLGGVPDPLGPLVAQRTLDTRDVHVLVGRRLALGVMPDEEHAVLIQRRPGAGLGDRGNTAGVGDVGTAALAVPTPIVERTRDRVALDLALAQVATHVAAVGVEDLDVALAVGEHDQLGAEGVDRVRLSVLEGLRQTEAVPTTGETGGGDTGDDLADFGFIGLIERHFVRPFRESSFRVRTRFECRAPATDADPPRWRMHLWH